MHTNKSLFVVFPIADKTITGLSFGKLSMSSATSLILSALATDEPPNFMTHVNWFSASPKPWFSVSFLSRTSTLPTSQLTFKTLLLQQLFTLVCDNPDAEAAKVEKRSRFVHRGRKDEDLLDETGHKVLTPANCNPASMLN